MSGEFSTLSTLKTETALLASLSSIISSTVSSDMSFVGLSGDLIAVVESVVGLFVSVSVIEPPDVVVDATLIIK